MSDLSRRDLLKGAALAGVGLAASGKFSSAIAENITLDWLAARFEAK